jgi:hypothetical protein
MTANVPHSQYAHLYVVVRVDADLSPENCFPLVSAWRTHAEAASEAERLGRLVDGQSSYRVAVTRLKGVT